MPLVLWVVVGWLGLMAPVYAAPASNESVDAVEDPRRLHRLGREALDSGDVEGARAWFTRMVERAEVRRYLPFRDGLRDALVLEALGRDDQAALLYREGLRDDPLRVVLVLRILSQHPDREALVQEAYGHVRSLVDDVEQGRRDAVIYVTSKGEDRALARTTTAQVLANARAGRLTRYCYVPELDLTAARGNLPDAIVLDRCVIGSIVGSQRAFGKLVVQKSFVLGDAVLGKAFADSAHSSENVDPSTFEDLFFRETVFMGEANFAAVEVRPGRVYFPMAVFEGPADFKGAEFDGVTDFRFASFGEGANFRFMRMTQPVYFGSTRYRADTVFSDVYSERDVYFNEAEFEGEVRFDGCEFRRGATFENSHFAASASFGTSRIGAALNLSRAVFMGPVNVQEVSVGSLDALGTQFRSDAWLMDANIEGRARFSLDAVTRARGEQDLDSLLPLYRDYQGDEDADEPLTRRSSYGVGSVEDLDARIDGNISFANTRFGGYTVFEHVRFGQPGADTVASFFNAQFTGETHFERTEWHSRADFTTIFGREVAFNEAHFHRALELDDANVEGRVNLTDATFGDAATLSFYAAEIRNFEIEPDQVVGVGRPHRLFHEVCAHGEADLADPRLARFGDDAGAAREACYDNVIDEFVALKDSYGERAMTAAEDDAYWWARHHAVMRDLKHGSWGTSLSALVRLLLFEICFGWGVRLGNLGLASAAVTVIFAGLYRVFCADTVLVYDGENIRVRDVSFVGLCFVSLQSLIAINTGWDFGDDDHTFRYLNTIETLIGFIILTFFVGAYTRMILAA